ncbi:MAG: hypothetical protein COV41_02470 [Candidatus Brennerbacteria bacterium CG11_big_fil_rev_8_21_14_0_20_43_10]|uniref:Uncharacterized protein n=1 Tax=Candidatus Brennerbacteria bacterium CG11_big_fil_rev_8_21_14_0_20_43_10 TaxID=1974523 RepID=A0A2H0PXD8_9BACT|nr:MAG: hypothetical protein COV41_02470 [Candidatus Brennerbacteria bacterium CG11_big_fil_rev_8_21_14_0_20_43_10]
MLGFHLIYLARSALENAVVNLVLLGVLVALILFKPVVILPALKLDIVLVEQFLVVLVTFMDVARVLIGVLMVLMLNAVVVIMLLNFQPVLLLVQ